VKLIKKLLAAPFVVLAAVIILLEDWLWDDLARLAAAIGRLPVLRLIEALIASLPPYVALVVFAVPSLLLIPVKLIALYFISHGQATLGFLTVLGAKIVGTALVARIFALTRPKLLRIAWFAWLYNRFMAFKGRIYAVIKSTRIYRAAHEQHLRLRAAVRSWLAGGRGFWRRRWNAAVKLSRRRKQTQA
jgi:hypothetical protein